MPKPNNDQIHAALSRYVLKLFDYEDWLLRGVGNTFMLVASMSETQGAPDDVKWRTTYNLHHSRIQEAFAVNLERRCAYEEMREVSE